MYVCMFVYLVPCFVSITYVTMKVKSVHVLLSLAIIHVNRSCLTFIGMLSNKLLIYCRVLKFFFLLMTLSMEHATDRPASARDLPAVEANFMANFLASFLPKTLSSDAAVA